MLARAVDSSDQFRERQALDMSAFFEGTPESIFKADAGLVSINYDGTFNNRGFHRGPPQPPCPLSYIHRQTFSISLQLPQDATRRLAISRRCCNQPFG